MVSRRTMKTAGVTALVVAGTVAVGLGGEAWAGRGGNDGAGRGGPGVTRERSSDVRGGRGSATAPQRGGLGVERESGRNGGRAGAAPAAALEPMLQAAWAEELAAQATYEAFVDAFGEAGPFAELAAAEARHAAAVQRVADRLGIELDPVAPSAVSVPATVAGACEAAVAIERADLAGYDEALDVAAPWPQVVRVLTNLRDASERHLDAALECR